MWKSHCLPLSFEAPLLSNTNHVIRSAYTSARASRSEIPIPGNTGPQMGMQS